MSSRNRRSGRSSVVEWLARPRLVAGLRIAMLAHHDLIEAERARLERDCRAGEIQAPGAVRALAGEGPRLVRARVESLGPVPAGPGVVKAQSLDVHDLPARALLLGERLADAGQLAIREHVAQEELELARILPAELVDDAMVQVEPAVLQARADAPEERGVVRDPDVLDHAHGRDLVVDELRRQVAIVHVVDAALALEPLALDALGGVGGLP